MRNGHPYLPRNLCRAFSRLFRLKRLISGAYLLVPQSKQWVTLDWVQLLKPTFHPAARAKGPNGQNRNETSRISTATLIRKNRFTVTLGSRGTRKLASSSDTKEFYAFG